MVKLVVTFIYRSNPLMLVRNANFGIFHWIFSFSLANQNKGRSPNLNAQKAHFEKLNNQNDGRMRH